MKINDVIITEAPMNAQQLRAAQDAAAGNPQAPAAVPAKQAPAKKSSKKASAPAAGNVPKQPTLNGQPSTGPKGQAWLKKYGATHNPDGTPKAAPGAADPSLDPYDPYKDPNVQMQPKSAADSAELDRMKQLAIGGNQPPVAAAPAPAPAPEPAAPAAPASPPPQANALGVTAQAGSAFGQPEPQADKPAGQATQPDAAPPAQVNPDTGLSAAPKPVTTGTGGKTNIVTGSDDEMAWRSKNPNWNMTGAQYPGPGNWDPKTGRSKAAQAQADKNWQGIKNFFGFGDKKQAAPAAAPQGQGTQPATTTGPNPPAGGYGRFQESELDTIKKLSGL